ncbi:hypothetical protein RHSP_82745 [Rhizobium freirei PRF 81]|uniref:Uncharacterized protein n=1 Tax=Rhizobium freirei PRF 81 TaxID=363754 RepID=N6TYK2_9HYPH|nr:hypothetical protein [Rhizobium freirei]ENN85469.1 hypothetical protein RHSP_82745 [Rhizobium freirei PRF 81]
MKFAWTIRRLFLYVAMLAALIGPMSIGPAGSAMALSAPNTMATAGSAIMSGMNMADNMPCCPEKQPDKHDCFKGCLLALLCTTSFSADNANGCSLPLSVIWQSHRYDLLPAAQLTPALLEPPARPPKV